MKKSASIILLVIVVLILGIFAFKPVTSDIKVGAVFPMTGGLASIGEDLQNGVRLAEKETGIMITITDGQADPAKSISAGQQLSDINKSSIILTAFRGASLSLASSLQNKDVLILSTTATTEGKSIATTSNNLFIIGAEMISAGFVPGQYAKSNLGCNKVGLVSEQSETGKDKLSGFAMGVGENKVVLTEYFQPSETDFKSLVSKIKSKNIDCIFVEIRSNSLPILLKQLDQQQIYPKILANSYSVTPQGIKDSPDSETKNVFFSSTALNTSNPDTVKFISNYKAMFNEEPTDFSAIGYELVKIISKPIRVCKNDISCLKVELSKIQDYESIVGKISINDNREIQLRDYNLYKINSGLFVKI